MSRKGVPTVRRFRRSAMVMLLGTSAALWGCGGSGASGVPPSASAYGQSAPAPRLLKHESQILDDLNARLQGRSVPRALLDARLGNAAAALNALRSGLVARDACDVGPGAVDAALQWAGVYERPVCQRCFWTRKSNVRVPEDVLQGLAECLATHASAGQPLLGMHTGTQDGRAFVSMVAVRRSLVLDPVSRVAPPGQPVALSGVLPAEGGPFRLLAGASNRPVEVIRLEADARNVFRAQLAPPPQQGELVWGVVNGAGQELLRATLRGSTRAEEPVFARVQEGVGDGPEAQLAALRAAVVQLRQQAGLSPVRWSAALDGAAQQEANQARPVSAWAERPPESSTVEAAASVGAAVRVFKLYGAGHGEIASVLRHSPAHLYALTRPLDVAVGLGVAGVPRDGGKAGVAAVLILATDTLGALDL